MTTCITTARECATTETAAERAERLALRDAIERAVLDREAECDRREPLHIALARIAKATKRRVSAKGARRAIRTLAEDEESTPQDAFDFMETDHADEVVEGVERGRVRAMRWEVL